MASPATAPTTIPAMAPADRLAPSLAGLPSAVYTRSDRMFQKASEKAAGLACVKVVHEEGQPVAE